ncbi:Dna binding response regulator PrrA (RegA) [Labilithrix luteola]|uniref:Dna binding response regulator PrrA (RegA) n=1 Tax=Labilithrix luteola TaxID=1391654 RepID=A0A0K1PQ08_9BACT|nr:Dna binding response regulator PrrA (RegA) [Labilithrix luteola]
MVDDDDRFRERLIRALADRGHEVQGARNVEEARRLAQSESPEWAVVDLRMPGPSGMDLVRDLVAIDPATRVVVLTGYGSIATAVEAVKLGAVDYLTKPADADQIVAALEGTTRRTGDGHADTAEIPSLARVEWEHIQRTLNDCNGNVTQAARALGIHRRSLQRKLSKNPVRR